MSNYQEESCNKLELIFLLRHNDEEARDSTDFNKMQRPELLQRCRQLRLNPRMISELSEEDLSKLRGGVAKKECGELLIGQIDHVPHPQLHRIHKHQIASEIFLFLLTESFRVCRGKKHIK